jgi:hypothetical protein
MLLSMSDAINLADPSFEPTDEQLAGLTSRAFAGVKAAHDQALARLRAEIDVLRAEALRAHAERSARDPEGT